MQVHGNVIRDQIYDVACASSATPTKVSGVHDFRGMLCGMNCRLTTVTQKGGYIDTICKQERIALYIVVVTVGCSTYRAT